MYKGYLKKLRDHKRKTRLQRYVEARQKTSELIALINREYPGGFAQFLKDQPVTSGEPVLKNFVPPVLTPEFMDKQHKRITNGSKVKFSAAEQIAKEKGEKLAPGVWTAIDEKADFTNKQIEKVYSEVK